MRHEIVSPESLRVLSAHVARLQQQIYNLQRRIAAARNELADVAVWVGKTDGAGITARSGTTPGTGFMEMYRVNQLGVLVPVVDGKGEPIEMTVYNMTSSAVGGEEYIQAKQDAFGTKWVDVEDCG